MRERGKPAMRRQTWPLPARLEPGCQKDGAKHRGEQRAGMAEDAQTLPSTHAPLSLSPWARPCSRTGVELPLFLAMLAAGVAVPFHPHRYIACHAAVRPPPR